MHPNDVVYSSYAWLACEADDDQQIIIDNLCTLLTDENTEAAQKKIITKYMADEFDEDWGDEDDWDNESDDDEDWGETHDELWDHEIIVVWGGQTVRLFTCTSTRSDIKILLGEFIIQP